MNLLATVRTITPEDLLSMPNGSDFELVDGSLVERYIGWESSWVGGRLFRLLAVFVEEHNLGWVAPADASYQCFPDDPSRVRRADVSFIRLDRLSADDRPQGHCPIAPDLAVEVVSPNDLYSEVETKVVEYLTAGVQLVWVIDPPTRTARIHRADGSTALRRESNDLDGESIAPGFRCAMRDLFRAPGT